jgi:beta-lactamase regulating signal transducer with metallopeptidase domain
MTTLSAVVTTALLQSLWQDAAVAAALVVVLAMLRGRSAQARYLAAGVALAAMAVLPVVTATLAWSRVVDVASFGAPVTIGRDVTAAWLTIHPRIGAAMLAGPTAPGPLATWLTLAQTWAFPLWVVGVALCSLRLLGSGLHVASLRRRSGTADSRLEATVARVSAAMGIARRVSVAIASVTSAATIGWLRPLILMPPAALAGLTPQQLEAIIAHELAHVRRHDYLVNLLQLVIETIFFYHPAVWWASHRMRVERELCCDDVAVKTCGDAPAYARALATMAAAPQPALGASGGSLRARIERLLGVASPRHAAFPRAGVAAVVLAAALASTGAWLHAQQPATAISSAATGTAALSGMVLDPLGNPVSNTPITLVGRGVDVVQPSATDADGGYRFDHLPAGQYSVRTPITDSILPMSVTLAAGEQRSVTIDLGVDDVAVNLRVCADCRSEAAPAAPAASAAPGIPDRPAIAGAEPVDGWDAFNARSFPYPPALESSGMQGTVLVEARVTSTGAVAGAHAMGMNMTLDAQRGRVRGTTCTTAECVTRFANAAVLLVEQQRWRPATVHGTPVDVPLHVTVEYTLTGEH